MKASAISLEEVFAILERYAIAGDRCPENGCHGVGNAQIPMLARIGRIRIEISGQNYRRVVILTGPNAGRATAPNPGGQKPWKIIDANGLRTNGKTIERPSTRRQPSTLPRF